MRISGTLSPVRFDGKTCAIAAISSDFQRQFLCNPDCVAGTWQTLTWTAEGAGQKIGSVTLRVNVAGNGPPQ